MMDRHEALAVIKKEIACISSIRAEEKEECCCVTGCAGCENGVTEMELKEALETVVEALSRDTEQNVRKE